MALFSSDTSVPMTIFRPEEPAPGSPAQMGGKEIWVFSVEQLDGSLRIEQDHVFRHFPEHRQALTYESDDGPYYLVRGHGHAVPAMDVAVFQAEWPQLSTRLDVVAVLD